MKILFLCTGNMHRSPLASAMLRGEIARDVRTDIEVASAGTIDSWALPPVSEAVQLASEAGLDLSTHRSRQVTAAILADADQIFVMERYHLEWIEKEHPVETVKCRLLSEYAGPDCEIAPGDEVPDAIGEDIASFRRTFSILSDCVRRLYRELPAPAEDVYTQAIEERFRLRRRTPLTLSHADYELAGRWWQQGIPLWIVIESIDDLFRKKEGAGDPGRVRRLSWCGRAVEARFVEYQRTHVAAKGGGEPADSPATSALFSAAVHRLRSAAERARERGYSASAQVFSKAADDILTEGPATPLEPSAARLALHKLEEKILEHLRLSTDEAEMTVMREAATSTLSAHRGRMTGPAFEATLERLVSQRLREFYNLFDLAAP